MKKVIPSIGALFIDKDFDGKSGWIAFFYPKSGIKTYLPKLYKTKGIAWRYAKEMKRKIK